MSSANGSATAGVIELGEVSDGADVFINMQTPKVYEITLKGTSTILFHAWNVESIEEKASAPRGSDIKKTDDIESYLYRDYPQDGETQGRIGIPGVAFVATLRETGRYFQDPRSTRKTAMDLIKSGLVPLDEVAPIKDFKGEFAYKPDVIDRRRVVVQRAGVTRNRPGMLTGWSCTFRIMNNSPQYLNRELLNQVVVQAGIWTGICDFRPTFGRFTLEGMKEVSLEEVV